MSVHLGERSIPIRVFIKRLYGKGFAAYVRGSARKRAVILADLHAVLNVAAGKPEMSWRQVFAESIAHEMLHVMQEVLDREFDEAEVEAALEATRRPAKDAGFSEGKAKKGGVNPRPSGPTPNLRPAGQKFREHVEPDQPWPRV